MRRKGWSGWEGWEDICFPSHRLSAVRRKEATCPKSTAAARLRPRATALTETCGRLTYRCHRPCHRRLKPRPRRASGSWRAPPVFASMPYMHTWQNGNQLWTTSCLAARVTRRRLSWDAPQFQVHTRNRARPHHRRHRCRAPTSRPNPNTTGRGTQGKSFVRTGSVGTYRQRWDYVGASAGIQD